MDFMNEEVGREDMVMSFDDMDRVEKMVSRDEVEKIKEESIYLSQHHSEIAASFGSNECLNYMVENDMELSPLVNLYAIVNDHQLEVNVPHDDELHLLITHHRLDRLRSGSFNVPDVETAVSTLYTLSTDFAAPDCIGIVRSLYSEEEWNSMSQCSVIKLLELNRADLVNHCRITLGTFRRIAELNMLPTFKKAKTAFRNSAIRNMMIELRLTRQNALHRRC